MVILVAVVLVLLVLLLLLLLFLQLFATADIRIKFRNFVEETDRERGCKHGWHMLYIHYSK